MIQLTLSESDFESVLSGDELIALQPPSRRPRTMSSPDGSDNEQERVRRITEALPRVIASKVKAMVPPEFRLYEIKISLEVSGKLFDAGIAGVVDFVLRDASEKPT